MDYEIIGYEVRLSGKGHLETKSNYYMTEEEAIRMARIFSKDGFTVQIIRTWAGINWW